MQHIRRVASVLWDSALQSQEAMGKSQSFAPRGSTGRDSGTRSDAKRSPLRDLFCGLCSIAFFSGSMAVSPLSGPSEETDLQRGKERGRRPLREHLRAPTVPDHRGAELERAERAAVSRNHSLLTSRAEYVERCFSLKSHRHSFSGSTTHIKALAESYWYLQQCIAKMTTGRNSLP